MNWRLLLAYSDLKMTESHIFNSKKFTKFLLDNFKTESYDKQIPAWVFFYNLEFMSGLISGFWDGDGNVHADKFNILRRRKNT